MWKSKNWIILWGRDKSFSATLHFEFTRDHNCVNFLNFRPSFTMRRRHDLTQQTETRLGLKRGLSIGTAAVCVTSPLTIYFANSTDVSRYWQRTFRRNRPKRVKRWSKQPHSIAEVNIYIAAVLRLTLKRFHLPLWKFRLNVNYYQWRA